MPKTLLSPKIRCFPLLSPCFPLAFPLFSLSLPRNISAEIALPYMRNMRQTHSTSQHCPCPSRYLGVYGTTQYLLHWRGRTARAGGRRGRTARAAQHLFTYEFNGPNISLHKHLKRQNTVRGGVYSTPGRKPKKCHGVIPMVTPMA